MKIVVFSDSHGRVSEMIDVCNREKPNLVIHLGDCTGDAAYLGRALPQLRLISIRGNNDWSDEPLDMELDTVVGRLYMCHGHRQGVKNSLDRLVYLAKAAECRVALYGHTHKAKIQEIDGVLTVNPGAAFYSGAYALCDDGFWSLKTLS